MGAIDILALMSGWGEGGTHHTDSLVEDKTNHCQVMFLIFHIINLTNKNYQNISADNHETG